MIAVFERAKTFPALERAAAEIGSTVIQCHSKSFDAMQSEILALPLTALQ
jgi:nitrate reductase NapAB chaperone NapD